MLTYPEIDPVAIALGPVKIHWYGIMYLVAFVGAWWLGTVRASKAEFAPWTPERVSDLLFYVALGVILGGRLGYILFYDFANAVADPIRIIRVWEGGMSFHGGLIGVIVAMILFARKIQRPFFSVADFVAPLIPVGLFTGRVGNFINGELWGKQTDAPWGMIFPTGGSVARHPSQLYEAALEGVVLFAILWIFSSKPKPAMAVSGLFLLGYGIFRFLVEFVRVPDQHLGYLALDWVTMGQILTFPMILGGIILIVLAYSRHTTNQTSAS